MKTVKEELIRSVQSRRGCFWVGETLVLWDGPRNKGAVMLSPHSVAPFELDPGLEGDRVLRFTTRRMKPGFVRQYSRRLTKAVCLDTGFMELPGCVFWAEPNLEVVEDERVRQWLQHL